MRTKIRDIVNYLFGNDFKLSKSNDYLHSHHMMPSTGALPGILFILYTASFIGYIAYLIFFD